MLITRLLIKYLSWLAGNKQIEKEEKIKPQLALKKQNTKTEATSELFEQGAEEDHFEPLSFAQAQMVLQNLRKAGSNFSPWRLIGWQVLVGILAILIALLGFEGWDVALSVCYGVIATVLPACAFAWGLHRGSGSKSAMSVSAAFFVWEIVKVGLTVAILLAAPALIKNLNWLALLAGFVVTMKVYWIAIWLYPMRKNSLTN